MKQYKGLVHVWLLKEGASQAVSQERVVLACGIPFIKFPNPNSEIVRAFADNPSQVAQKQKDGWYKAEGFSVCKDCLKKLDVALLYEVDL